MFKQNHVFLGKIEKGSTNHVVEWEFADGFSKENVEKASPGCGCTSAVVTNKGIIASFNESDVSRMDDTWIAQNRAIYPNGFVTTKEVTVFPNDGIPSEIVRPDGGSYANPEKNRLVITFSALVNF